MTAAESDMTAFLAGLKRRWENREAAEKAARKAAWDALPEEEKQRRIAEKERENREALERERREAEAERIAGFSRLGIPERYHGATWENFIADTAEKKRALAAVRQAWRKNLYLCGGGSEGNGTGKTHLAMCLVKEGATFRKLYQIFDEIRHDLDRDTKIIEWYSGRELLILDEAGRQKFTDFEHETFFKIIDNRWDRMLPTTVIGNLEPKEFAGRFGTAVLSRLHPEIVSFAWEDMRKKAAYVHDDRG